MTSIYFTSAAARCTDGRLKKPAAAAAIYCSVNSAPTDGRTDVISPPDWTSWHGHSLACDLIAWYYEPTQHCRREHSTGLYRSRRQTPGALWRQCRKTSETVLLLGALLNLHRLKYPRQNIHAKNSPVATVIATTFVRPIYIYKCKKLNSLKHLVRTTGWITKLKQQISKRRYYLSAHWLHGDVLLSNSAFLILINHTLTR